MSYDAMTSRKNVFSQRNMFSLYHAFTKDPLGFCENSLDAEGNFYSFKLFSKTFHILSEPAAAQHVLVDRQEARI